MVSRLHELCKLLVLLVPTRGEGIHTYACANIHTNNKFTSAGEFKIPTLLTPNPKVHGPTSNNPNSIEIPEHCPLT